ITYGSTSNTQDLKNYKVFIVCEPNSQFTAAEKTAIMNFVKNGGGLFMVSDHTISDRNNDGWDSPMIWNDFLTTNSVQVNPFGIAFDLANISQTTTNVATLTKDSILHGTMGSVTEAMWSNGTTMTLNKTINSTVLGQIFKTGSSTTGTTNVMFATARYGSGKVAAIGDSSPCDDGTGNSGNSLYDGYWTDAAGNHQKLLMNATIWLATANKSTSTGINNVNSNEINLSIYPNPILNGNLHFSYSLNESTPVKIQLFDATGKVLRTINFKNNAAGTHDEMINVSGIGAGMYLGRISTATGVTSKLIEINR
ncbi:MAG: T9SS type A sorting domain-containing protein, partial [Paludibacter sp.]